MKIVVLDGYTLNPGDLSWADIEQLGELTVYEHTSPEQILERAQAAEILLTNKTPLNAATLAELKSLRYIGVLATGYNVVDVQAAAEQGVTVSNIPTYGTGAVAQMTFAMILELCHHVQKHSDTVHSGAWSKCRDFCFWNFPILELEGKVLGIIGFGRIGQRVADIAQAFGMRILAYDKTRMPQVERKNFAWADLDELFRQSDFISLHCPLFADNQGLICRKNIEKMKGSAFLINTSRGHLIVEEDLADALNRGRIAGAALDVLATEPPKADNPLLNAENCLITPHIAWAAREARARLMSIAAENIRAFLSGQELNTVK